MARLWIALALAALTASGCSVGDAAAGVANQASAPALLVEVTIRSSSKAHVFRVETARTSEEQQRGLMYRTGIPADGGMLFAPYPVVGPPSEANFWMRNTPSPLDILFIRADGTIARIAENTVPFSETPIPSGEPVAAVLEINGGLSAELGIEEGDRVTWPGQPGGR